jgi:tRNA(Ile)-lysidine synthase
MFKEETIQNFKKLYFSLEVFKEMIFSKTPILAYSGGKDSTFLAAFYFYLYQEKLCPEPILFHLNHLIRNNSFQEEEISNFISKKFNQVLVKKKIFPN